MNKVLNGLPFAIAYLDDIIIFSETPKQHLAHIRVVLKRLQAANLRMKRRNCSFFKELHYLGHLLTTKGIKPQLEKVKAISELKPPKNTERHQRISRYGGILQKIYTQVCRCC